MLDRARSKKILDEVLAAGRKLGAGADVRVSLTGEAAQNVRFGRGEITSSGETSDQVIEVTVSFGKRHASATANQPDPASLRALVEQAARLARLSPEDPEWLPPLLPGKWPAAVDAFDETTARLGTAARAEAASAALAAGKTAGLEMSGFYELTAGSYAVANSAGLFAHRAYTDATFTCTARTADGTGSGRSGQRSHRAAGLDVAGAAKAAAEKAVRSARPKPLAPGRYTVVLEPIAVAELLAFLVDSLAARAADEGRSFFARPGGGTRIGEQIFPAGVTLRSDPADADVGAAIFDREGAPTPATTWIDRGKLVQLTTSRYWAQKQGRPHTPDPGTYALIGGTAGDADLLKGIERGVWISRFWYSRSIDPRSCTATGLTRDGVFLIEKGEIVGPVNNFRWNESPVNMLARADVLGPSVVTPGEAIRTPALRTHDFNLASVSDAV